MNGLSWLHQAQCRGMSTGPFFPADRGLTPEAAAVCGVCPVTGPCGEHGAGFYGTWAGVGEKARLNRNKNAARKRRGVMP